MTAGVADEELRLGRYTLKRPLGEGGNGQVFLAWQENAAGEPLVCVVKFPLQRFATDPEGRTRFMDEARLAMRLGTHLNIVHVIDVDVHREMPFIVMEYVDGTDLRSLLKHCRKRGEGLSLPTIYSILSGAAAGLHHAHAGATVARQPVGVVHRDIKPGNILVTRDGVTKLADFGISTTVDEGTTGSYMRGTYRYMSPEHISREVCPQMDIYALGVVAWEMVENRQYRAGFEGTQHFTAIMDGDVPPLENPATPKEFRVIIEACLEPNPRQRPSAKELLSALEQCPEYTRYSSDLQDVIGSVVGHHRSSGKTLHELAVTPELAATFAALEAAQKKAAPAAAAGPKVIVEPPKPDVPTTIEGPPGFMAGLPARQPDTPAPEVDERDDSELETNKRPAAEAPAVEVDVPQPRDWKRATPQVPTATVALSPAEHTPVPPTVALPDWAAQPSASGTELLPAPTHEDDPPQDAVVPNLRGQTEPAPTATRPGSPPGPVPATVPDTLESKTDPVAVRRGGVGLMPLLVICLGLAVGSALVVAYVLGAFDRSDAPLPTPAEERAPKPEPTELPAVELEPTAPELPAGELESPAPILAAVKQPLVAAPGPRPILEEVESTEALNPEDPAAAPRPSSPRAPTPKTKRTAPPVAVKLVLFLLDEAEVKIGPKTVTVRRGTDIQVPAGRHRVRWRVPGEKAWHDAGRKRFAAERRYLVRLRSSGDAEVVALNQGAGGSQ